MAGKVLFLKIWKRKLRRRAKARELANVLNQPDRLETLVAELITELDRICEAQSPTTPDTPA